jgi:hypothetical protein
VVLAVAFTAIVFSFYNNGLQIQINNLKNPHLVTVSLNYTDNQQGIIQITGYVYNAGDAAAYNDKVQVNLYRNGVLFNTTQVPIQDIPAATSVYVDEKVTYLGSPPTEVTLTLGWTQGGQIPRL